MIRSRTGLFFLVGILSSASALKIFYNDPEVYMTTPQIIRHWGYPVEVHNVTTEDGYIIQMHRIPHGKEGPTKGDRPVMFMQPGFNCDSAYYVINLPNESAAFVFADAGYDVWIGNIRGNRYGRGHLKYSTLSQKFWDYNIDHIATRDLPAMIDHVLKDTGKENLYYMGHSQGTLSMFMSLAESEEMNKKVKQYFALAPVGTVKYIKGGFRALYNLIGVEMNLLYKLLGPTMFNPDIGVNKLLSHAACGLFATSPQCTNIFYLISGPSSAQTNDTRTSVYMAQSNSGTSTQNVNHWLQMVKSGKMHKFDYGAKKNAIVYGQATPPLYDLTKITTPTHLYWGDADWLATKEDVEEFLIPTLKDAESHFFPRWNHMDFLFGMNATSAIYYPILEMLKKEAESV